jgi:hypothetical protein
VAEGPNDKRTDKDYLGLTTDEWIAGIQAFIFLLQLGAFSYQGYKLRQTVSSMNVQSTDMKASIAESVRAADAMESVSASLAENTATTKTIIENQRTYASIQMRAYLSIVTGACVPQDKTTNWRRGVVVTIACGRLPARRPNIAISHTFCASFGGQAPTSSPHSPSCWGPRSRSASSAL